jgi:UDP-N-acetylglucosamine/UDP-N-acetylgalactosamine diphosphorylase
MTALPPEVLDRLRRHGQEHVLAFWSQLASDQRQELLAELQTIDLDLLGKLYTQRDMVQPLRTDRLWPVPVIAYNSPDSAERKQQGEECLRLGKVAVLLVAGGQGSRLGFEHPKGMYPVGPVSQNSLFQIHAEKVLALTRRYGKTVPFLVMTSPATHDETVAYFKQQQFFGLGEANVYFFCQGTMPALDLATGRLLLESPGRLFLSPDGHGGTLTALATSGLLNKMKSFRIEHIFYFQVDNPLVKIAEPVFLGHHLAARSEVSSRVIAKRGPEEKVGVYAQIDGRCTIVEYSDLPDELAQATDETGRLRLWAGSPAIHLFEVAFLDRMTADPESLPFHIARKKVECIDEQGRPVRPTSENALKFERFIFDVLPAARRWCLVETLRASEFAPLKNAEGEDSPATVELALVEQAVEWITRSGGVVTPGCKVEISPLYALDAEELARKLPPGTSVDATRYFA